MKKIRGGLGIAKPVVIDGHRFPSRAEGAYYVLLKQDELRGKVRNIRLQVRYALSRRVGYIADFVFDRKHGEDKGPGAWFPHVVDVKGWRTPEYKLKKTLLEDLHNVTVEEVTLKNSQVQVLLAAYQGVVRAD